MLAVIILSVAVPVVTCIGYWALRNKYPDRVADVRGIALQTVIIIVVLLAIAGAVAGVLISQGDEAAEQIRDQDMSVNAAGRAGLYKTNGSCTAAGFTWKSNKCEPK